MRISDWSSDVCSSDLNREAGLLVRRPAEHIAAGHQRRGFEIGGAEAAERGHRSISWLATALIDTLLASSIAAARSEEHTSELQSLMRISYAVFCLKKKIKHIPKTIISTTYNEVECERSHLVNINKDRSSRITPQ